MELWGLSLGASALTSGVLCTQLLRASSCEEGEERW